MTALTGETGAGKTLLVEALQLVLGERASAGLVRAGSAEALVEARFTTDDGEILLARAVPASGRSRAWVDGRMAPVAVLAEVGDGLVEIHGQHDQQSLLSPAAQRRALDELRRRGPATARMRPARAGRGRGPAGRPRRRRAAAGPRGRRPPPPAPRDRPRRAGRPGRGRRAAGRRGTAGRPRRPPGGRGRGARATRRRRRPGGAGSLLGAAIAALAGRQPFAADEGRLRAAAAEIADLATDLRTAVDTWEDDPARSGRRPGPPAAARRSAPQVRADAGRRRRLPGPGRPPARRPRGCGGGGRDPRRRAAAGPGGGRSRPKSSCAGPGRPRRRRWPTAAGERLRTLAMPDACFDVAVGDDGPGDDVRFLLGANRGEPTQPLARVASGGELARTMLALRLRRGRRPGDDAVRRGRRRRRRRGRPRPRRRAARGRRRPAGARRHPPRPGRGVRGPAGRGAQGRATVAGR